jgi:hypothetical protein
MILKSDEAIKAVHTRLHPKRYVEIGVRKGETLKFGVNSQIVGIGSGFDVHLKFRDTTLLFQMSSEEYFATRNLLHDLGGQPFDYALINGLHTFERVLDEFIHLERAASPESIIAIRGVLPRNAEEAATERTTPSWVGDVWRIIPCLAEYRPDLELTKIATTPTGVMLIRRCNPADRTLEARKAQLIERFVRSTDFPFTSQQDFVRRFGFVERAMLEAVYSAIGRPIAD